MEELMALLACAAMATPFAGETAIAAIFRFCDALTSTRISTYSMFSHFYSRSGSGIGL